MGIGIGECEGGVGGRDEGGVEEVCARARSCECCGIAIGVVGRDEEESPFVGVEAVKIK